MLIGDFITTPNGTAQILNYRPNDRLLIATLDGLDTVERSACEVASFVDMADLINAWWIQSWYR